MMTMKDKSLLLQIHDKVKKLTQQPPTTYSAYDGTTPQTPNYQPPASPQPLPPLTKYKG